MSYNVEWWADHFDEDNNLLTAPKSQEKFDSVARVLAAIDPDLVGITEAPNTATTTGHRSTVTTAAVAVGIADRLGGLPGLTAVVVITTGIVGAAFGPGLRRSAGVHDERAVGRALGLASHGIGTAGRSRSRTYRRVRHRRNDPERPAHGPDGAGRPRVVGWIGSRGRIGRSTWAGLHSVDCSCTLIGGSGLFDPPPPWQEISTNWPASRWKRKGEA
jgi:hypothetical protein